MWTLLAVVGVFLAIRNERSDSSTLAVKYPWIKSTWFSCLIVLGTSLSFLAVFDLSFATIISLVVYNVIIDLLIFVIKR